MYDTAASDAAVTAAAETISGLVSISKSDAVAALKQYRGLSINQKTIITSAIATFSLSPVLTEEDVAAFSDIAKKVNFEVTGDEKDYKGVSLIIKVIKKLNQLNKNGAWATDDPADTTKIKFDYNSSDPLIKLAISQLNVLIGSMETLNNKISSKSGATVFDKVLTYSEEVINSYAADTSKAGQITALKAYLDSINDDYYRPYKTGDTQPGGGDSTTHPQIGKKLEKAIKDYLKAYESASEEELKELLENIRRAVEEEIASEGSISLSAIIKGGKATADPETIMANILLKADDVKARAALISKALGDIKVPIIKKLIIDIKAKDADLITTVFIEDMLTKLKEKGIDKLQVSFGRISIDFDLDIKDSLKKSGKFNLSVDNKPVTDAVRANLDEEAKLLLSQNIMLFNISDTFEPEADSFRKQSAPFTVKIKYDLKPGENGEQLTVFSLAPDGTILNMAAEYDSVTGELVFETNLLTTFIVKYLLPEFTDVKTGAWYKSYVDALYAKGIITPREGNKFEPDKNITRADFIKMLVLAAGINDESAVCNFKDVDKNSEYYSYIATAVNAGITSGIGNQEFGPDKFITRQDMAVMMVRALEVKTIVNADKYLNFSDKAAISAYAKDSLALCVKNGFLKGSNDKINPKGKTTRAMAAVVIYKYFKFIH